jgi:hypothetical protein
LRQNSDEVGAGVGTGNVGSGVGVAVVGAGVGNALGMADGMDVGNGVGMQKHSFTQEVDRAHVGQYSVVQ